MSRYAESTQVSSDRSRVEIERTLTRYGASGFLYGWEGSTALVSFKMGNRTVKFQLPLPDKQGDEFWHTPARGTKRHPDDAARLWEQATRQRWRALALVIKAKLEAIESGITTFDQEFLAHICIPGGQTAGEWLTPQFDAVYASGAMPRGLLEAGKAK